MSGCKAAAAVKAEGLVQIAKTTSHSIVNLRDRSEAKCKVATTTSYSNMELKGPVKMQ